MNKITIKFLGITGDEGKDQDGALIQVDVHHYGKYPGRTEYRQILTAKKSSMNISEEELRGDANP